MIKVKFVTGHKQVGENPVTHLTFLFAPVAITVATRGRCVFFKTVLTNVWPLGAACWCLSLEVIFVIFVFPSKLKIETGEHKSNFYTWSVIYFGN